MDYWDLQRLRKTTAPSEREEANAYLGCVGRVGRLQESNALEIMGEMRDENALDATDDDTIEIAREQGYTGMAHHITPNPPSQVPSKFFW